jgi:hypothetical protein
MLGKHCKAYYLATARASWGTLDATSGRYKGAAPAGLTEIESAKDVTVPGERDAAEASDRGADHKSEDTGAWGGRVTLTLNHRHTDTARQAINKAFITNKPIPIAILNGDKATSGVTGLWAEFKVVKWEESQPEKEHVTYSVELALYDGPDGAGIAPQWVQVS